MSWLRVDDNFLGHPKLLAAATHLGKYGLGRALVVWHQGQAHASKYLTDGKLAGQVVARFHDEPEPLRVADALVSAGLWQKNGDGYIIHDYLEYNPSAAEIREKREQDRQRKADKSARNPRRLRTESTASRARDPIPSPPSTQKEEEQEHVPSGTVTEVTVLNGFYEFWQAYPNHKAKKDALKAWKALKPSPQLQAVMCQALARQCQWADWHRDEGKYVPLLATWLRGDRWEDESGGQVAAKPARASPSWRERCHHDPPCETAPMHNQREGIEAIKREEPHEPDAA